MASDKTPGTQEANRLRAARRAKLAQLSGVRTAFSEDQLVLLRDGFIEIFKEHEHRVSKRLAKRGLGGPEAEDLGQDVFLSLYNWMEKNGYPVSVARMLHVIMKCTFSTYLREKVRTPESTCLPSSQSELPTSQPDVEQALDLRELARRYVPRLKPIYRAVVQKVHLEGMSYEEAAAALELAEGTVKSRLNKAEDMLRALAQRFLPKSQRRSA
jgi:RNA polymerase sigma-70 factor (ECF subfamily)